MYGLALCLISVGQPQGLPVPYKTPKNWFWFVDEALAVQRQPTKVVTTNQNPK
jgi:hypothetical protein